MRCFFEVEKKMVTYVNRCRTRNFYAYDDIYYGIRRNICMLFVTLQCLLWHDKKHLHVVCDVIINNS